MSLLATSSVSSNPYSRASALIADRKGPLLFKDEDGPRYVPGLRGVLGIFAALIGVIGIQVINLYFLNKVRQTQRVKHGKPKFINDTSMSKAYVAYGSDQQEGTVKLGQNGESLWVVTVR